MVSSPATSVSFLSPTGLLVSTVHELQRKTCEEVKERPSLCAMHVLLCGFFHIRQGDFVLGTKISSLQSLSQPLDLQVLPMAINLSCLLSDLFLKSHL